LGETASALEWLETALAEREPYLGSLIVLPGYDAIRDQARFMRLTRELKLSASLRSRPPTMCADYFSQKIPRIVDPEVMAPWLIAAWCSCDT